MLFRSGRATTMRRVTALLMAGALCVAGCSSGGAGSSADVAVTLTTTVAASGSQSSGAISTDSTASTTVASVTPSSSEAPPSTSADAPAGPTSDTSADTEVWADNSMVPHLFFHALVVDPERAFGDAESGAGYLDYMVTRSEFGKILQQVYDHGYVLVSPHQLATVESDGRVTPKTLKLPKGKKPLVISIDDVSYYEYMQGDGFATNLFVAEDGRVLNNYTDAQGNTLQGSYDVMPMVDDFVRQHPEFSHDGARGVIALTGYNGVLGYRSSPSEYTGKNPNLDQDIATAEGVAHALKEEGWEFASHSWGHINFTDSSLGRIQADTAKWKAEVEPVVGPTDLLIYPFGADISGVARYRGEKFEYLKGQGYSFFFNVDGSTAAWGQWGDRYLREARINIDGISMKAAVNGRTVLDRILRREECAGPAAPGFDLRFLSDDGEFGHDQHREDRCGAGSWCVESDGFGLSFSAGEMGDGVVV